MEITLCDYDFTALYEEQAPGYTAAPQLPEISQDDTGLLRRGLLHRAGEPALRQRRFLPTGCGSRACGAGPRLPMSAGSAAPSPTCPTRPGGATAEQPQGVSLLLDGSGQYMGYVTVTDGDRVAGMHFTFPIRAFHLPTARSLDLTAEGEYCSLTLEQVQQGGAPDPVHGVPG